MCLKFPTSEEDMAQRVRRCLAWRPIPARSARRDENVPKQKKQVVSIFLPLYLTKFLLLQEGRTIEEVSKATGVKKRAVALRRTRIANEGKYKSKRAPPTPTKVQKRKIVCQEEDANEEKNEDTSGDPLSTPKKTRASTQRRSTQLPTCQI